MKKKKSELAKLWGLKPQGSKLQGSELQGPILILGANGQVGRCLRRALEARGLNKQVWFSSRKQPSSAREIELELANPASIEACIRKFTKEAGQGKGTVILSGAFTHVDACEEDQQKCRQVNFEATKTVTDLCTELGHHFVFYSSEYVYGGAEYEDPSIVGPFKESDPVAPCSAYAQAKVDSESYILENSVLEKTKALSATIIRTTVIFSWDSRDKNFAMQLYRYLANRLSGKNYPGVPDRFRIPTDQVSSPTYAPILAEATLELAARKAPGIYHLTGSDSVARSEFAKQLIRVFGFSQADAEAELEFVATKDLHQTARRPLTAGLNTDKAKAEGVPIWSLEEAYAEWKPPE